MAVLLFILAIVASFIVVRLGSVALQVTGIEPKQARFQALSAFSGAGFTTRESEMVIAHPARRRVITMLIIGGNAGLVTMIGTLAGSVGFASGAGEPWSLFGAIRISAQLVPYLKVMIFILVLIILYRIAQTRPIRRLITRVMKKAITRGGLVREVSYEEMLLGAEGYGISQIEIEGDNPLIGTPLTHSGLKDRQILVLMVESGDSSLVPPPAFHSAQVGERWTLFGPLTAIREMAVAEDERDAPMPEPDEDEED